MHGFQINQKQGRREWLARMGATTPVRFAECAYGTGWDTSASDALSYVLLLRISQSASSTAESVQYRLDSWRPDTQEFTASWAGMLRYHSYMQCEQTHTLVPSPVTPASIVDMVRTTFVLSVSDAAEVFRVSRPTIYQWSKLKSMEQIRSGEDRDRLKKLYGLVATWAARPALRGSWYRHVLPSGQTVIDLLKGEQLDSAEFAQIHILLEQQCHMLQATEHIKARQATHHLRELAARMDADRPDKASRSDSKAKEGI